MKQNGKRWISLALVLCMVLTLLPVTAAAANRDFTENAEIQSTRISTDTTWFVEEGVTVTMKGTVTVAEGSTLTLTGSGTFLRDFSGTNGMFYVNGGELIIDGVTIDGNGENIAITGTTTKSNAIKIEGASGCCTLRSGTIQNCKQQALGAAVYVSTSSSFTMEGGTIRDNTMCRPMRW